MEYLRLRDLNNQQFRFFVGFWIFVGFSYIDDDQKCLQSYLEMMLMIRYSMTEQIANYLSLIFFANFVSIIQLFDLNSTSQKKVHMKKI